MCRVCVCVCACAGSFSQCVFTCVVSVGRLQGVSLLHRMSACNACLHEAIWNVRCVCECVCVCVSVCV